MIHRSFAGGAGTIRGGASLAPRRQAQSHGAGEVGNGDKFLAAAAASARSASNEAKMPPPEKARPCDYTEWILLDRLDAMIQRMQ